VRTTSLIFAVPAVKKSLSSTTGEELKNMMKTASRANGLTRKACSTFYSWTTIPRYSPLRKKESKVAFI
jgi:hypothetical protein